MNERKLFHVLGLMVLLGLAVVPAGSAESRPGAESNPIEASFQSPESSGSLVWNTFLGGSVDDSGSNMAFDASGNMYTCGTSGATWGMPIDPFAASSDAYVAKLSPTGALVWNTFLGGNGSDSCRGISLDHSGNVYIAGYSAASWGIPLRAYAGYGDAFAAKLSPSGALVWNTFLGGNSSDYSSGMRLDDSGDIFLTGLSENTWGTPLNPYSSEVDVFVAMLDPSGALAWNTFIGGYYSDSVADMAIDTSGTVYLTGEITTAMFAPGNSIARQEAPQAEMIWKMSAAFVAALDATGALLWQEYLGFAEINYGTAITVDPAGNVLVTAQSIYGDGYEPADVLVAKFGPSGLLWSIGLFGGNGWEFSVHSYDIAGDAGGNVYITGYSGASWGTPLRPFTGEGDAFVAKLNPGGAILWNTFLGGASADSGGDIKVDGSGNIFVSGQSYSTWGTPRRPFAGGEKDAFVAALAGSGPLLWNTFLGGSGKDNRGSLNLDGSGNLYVTGSSDAGWGTPLRPYSGGFDAFVAKLDAYVPISARSFRSAGAYDGWVLESTGTSNAGGSLNSSAVVFRLGDDASDRQYRSILSFDTSALPDKIVITKATLWIRRYGTAGTNPFTTHGGLKVDIRKPYFGGWAALFASDFQAVASRMGAATFNQTPSATGWQLAALNATAYPYINRTGTTQFRLRFWLDDNDDQGADYVLFHSGNALTLADRPRLAVQYFVP